MLDKISTFDDSLVFKQFLQSEIRLQWALLKFKFDSDFKALWSLRQAWFAAKKGKEMFPDFLPIWKTYGLLNVTFGTIPERYQWIAGLLGLNGDIDEGLAQLTELYESDNFMAVEGGLLLALINAYFYNDYQKSAHYLEELKASIPESFLLLFLRSSIYIKDSKSENALKAMEAFDLRKTSTDQYITIPYMDYMREKYIFKKVIINKLPNALQIFTRQHKGKNTLKDANFKIAMCYWLLGDQKKAQNQIHVAATTGQTKNEVDKNADYIIREGKLPNQILLKIRYSTDGGYFEKADSIVNNTSSTAFKDKKDKIEFIYRRSRLDHKTEKIESAKKGYHKEFIQGNRTVVFRAEFMSSMGLYLQKGRQR